MGGGLSANMKLSEAARLWAIVSIGDRSRLRVRREKALDFSGCNSRPGTGSLHPVLNRNDCRGNEAVGAFGVEGR